MVLHIMDRLPVLFGLHVFEMLNSALNCFKPSFNLMADKLLEIDISPPVILYYWSFQCDTIVVVLSFYVLVFKDVRC